MIRICIYKRTPLKVRKRLRNKARLRKKIMGVKSRPRLVVFRSQKHIYAQLVDDQPGVVLTQAGDLSLKDAAGKTKTQKARLVGGQAAANALKLNIKKVVFDRNGFIYHGRVKALAEGARAGGLVF